MLVQRTADPSTSVGMTKGRLELRSTSDAGPELQDLQSLMPADNFKEKPHESPLSTAGVQKRFCLHRNERRFAAAILVCGRYRLYETRAKQQQPVF
jgi:hypothetical protein